jgi:DHA1 family bicyclomycin/chloramphenicol resistance-like MFS transporter
MRISPHSIGFTLMLSAIAALPAFGIDMSLPALGSIGASLGVDAGEAGLTMSLFMLGFAVGPFFGGPVSDRIGRRPVLLLAVAIFAAASLGCAVSRSLPALLTWRVAEGIGAGLGMTTGFAIIRDLFEGEAGRTKLSYVASLMLFIPMVAPAAGTLMLTIGNWRGIYGLLCAVGICLAAVIGLCFEESAKLGQARSFSPAAMLREYAVALTNRACAGYILVNAAGFGALFAYVSGSSLFFIEALGLSRSQYSLIFAATSVGIMLGALVNARLSKRGIGIGYPLGAGLALAGAAAATLMVAILLGWAWVPGLAAILVIATLAFGLIAPNAMHAAMQPLPTHAGAVSAIAGSAQVLVGSISSALVVLFSGQHPGFAMAASMVFWSAMALLAYVAVARPGEAAPSRRPDAMPQPASAPAFDAPLPLLEPIAEVGIRAAPDLRRRRRLGQSSR